MNKKTYYSPEIVKANYCKDNHHHTYAVAKCPYCCNFFVAREDSIKNGHTKSCGCLKHRRQSNTYYFPMGCDYGIGFYNNSDGFFIFDVDKYDCISKYYWSNRNANNRFEPTTSINDKTTSMARFLMQTPEGLEVDHINRNPSDNRIKNLRNCTHLENSHNRSTEKEHPEYGEFSFERSQEIAKEIETHQFENLFCLGETLEEISHLPEKNIYKVIFRNLCRHIATGNFSESIEHNLLKLISDYKLSKSENNENIHIHSA